MELSIAQSTEKLTVSETVFGQEFNPTLVHQIVTAYRAKGRQGSKAQKSRSEVRGGGAKPWRQKGMGKARAGTIRSPIWVGGGCTFAAKPRDFSQKVNRKMYRAALRVIFSKLAVDGRLVVVDSINIDTPKTKIFAAKLKEFDIQNALIILDSIDENTYIASRNIPNVNLIDTHSIDPVSLLKHKQVLVTTAAVKAIEEALI
jgi:large subunit ribosomal protein L4